VLAPHIGRFDTAKPNVMELEILSGRKIGSESELRDACEAVLARGLRRIFVSRGRDGCLYMDREGRVIERRLRPVEKMVNATGAGDAFTAAVIYSDLNGFSAEQTVDYGLAAGIAAISHEKTINPNMSVSLLESILKEYAL
jgi:pseudouridine kinase